MPENKDLQENIYPTFWENTKAQTSIEKKTFFKDSIISTSYGVEIASFPDPSNDLKLEKNIESKDHPKENQDRSKFRKLCIDILAYLSNIRDMLPKDISPNDKILDECLEHVVAIEDLFEELYEHNWGDTESLKKVVTIIQSQINNVDWTYRHIVFLVEAVNYIKARYTITDQAAEEIKQLVKEHHFNLFRGTVSSDSFKKRYKIVEIQ